MAGPVERSLGAIATSEPAENTIAFYDFVKVTFPLVTLGAEEAYKTLATGENHIHGLVYVSSLGKLFASTRTSPAKVIRFNAPLTNLSDYTVLTFPNDGAHNDADYMVYSSTTGKLYVLFTLNTTTMRVAEVDPSTLATTDKIADATGSYFASAMEILGGNLYIAGYKGFGAGGGCEIFKYNTSTFTRDAATGLLTTISDAATYIHALRTDGTSIFGSTAGNLGYILKTNTALSSTTIVSVLSDGYFTDDCAIEGGYAWFGIETGSKVGRIIRADLTNIATNTEIVTGISYPVYGAIETQGSVWVLYASSPGRIAQINPANSTIIGTYILATGRDQPNEIVSDGNRFYISFWKNPADVGRYMIDDNTARYTNKPGGFVGDIDGASETWIEYDVKVGEINQTQQRALDVSWIEFGNLNNVWSNFILNTGIENRPVQIYQAWFNPDTDAKLGQFSPYPGRIDRAQYSKGRVKLAIVPEKSGFSQMFPARVISPICGYIFKDTLTCQYTGTDITCDHTRTACSLKSNLAHFGGFDQLPDPTKPILWRTFSA